MNRRHALGLLTGAGLTACGKKAPFPRWRGVLFGIPVHLDFRGIDYDEAQKLGSSAFAHVQSFERAFSLWEESSELSQLNQKLVLSSPSPVLLDLLGKAGELYGATGGTFDPTIHSYLTWSKKEYAEGREPDAAEAEARRKLVDFSRVEISQKAIRIPEGFSLDLNAIVQGYVTDRVVEFLSDQCESALVNFGEYRVVGQEPWSVEVGAKNLSITRALAVSSGAGERLSATSRANHLINPSSGASPEPKQIIAIEADEAWLADGLATVVSVGGDVPQDYTGVMVHRF